MTSRAEAYRQLARAAAVLQELEPHSPIPYLVQRAVQLGSLPFPDLIKALIREPNVLAELAREFGLGEAPSGGAPPANCTAPWPAALAGSRFRRARAVRPPPRHRLLDRT